ncbi:MAG: glycosyltransferase family 4 protein [Phycisphaerales bacterium]
MRYRTTATKNSRAGQQPVCLVRNGYYPDDPRSEKEAIALVEGGYQVDVICLRGKKQPLYEEAAGLRLYRIPVRHKRTSILRYFFQYSLSFLLFGVLQTYLHIRRRYRCIHVATMPDFLVFTTLLPRLLGARVLLDLHEPTPELWVTKFGNHLRPLLRLQTRIEQTAIGYADATITVTDELRERVIERGARGEKISIVRNVCDEQMFSGMPSSEAAPNGQGFCLITHGSIEERYGHEEIIRAVARVRDRIPGLRLQVPGSGEYASQLKELAKELYCLDIVDFAGFVSRDELLRQLRAADAGIIAMRRSPYSELIDTNKMYEYIVLHKPILISRLQPVARKFDDSCVKFFEPGDHEDLARCILELYQDPQRGRMLAENAYVRYEAMRWEHGKQDYLKVVQGLVARN